MSATSDISSQSDAIRAILALVRPGLDRVEATLTELSNTDDHVMGPMLSTVLPGGGKRLRPALALVIGRLGDVDSDTLNHMAVGVELLHTASLVHDDIVDDADTRRGSATLYARVGNALAVMVGDYLFAQAAHECVATGDLRVVRLFAETLGAMARGQIDEANSQLNGQHAWQTLSRDDYLAATCARGRSHCRSSCCATAAKSTATTAQPSNPTISRPRSGWFSKAARLPQRMAKPKRSSPARARRSRCCPAGQNVTRWTRWRAL